MSFFDFFLRSRGIVSGLGRRRPCERGLFSNPLVPVRRRQVPLLIGRGFYLFPLDPSFPFPDSAEVELERERDTD